MLKTISKDDEGIYTTTLYQIEILLLYAGVLPYVAYDHDPMVPDDEFLWIHQEEKPEDKFPQLDPIPCKVLSCVQFLPDLFILTLKPEEIDIEFEQHVEDFKLRMNKKFSTLRTQALIDPLSFN